VLLESINPTDGAVLGQYNEHTDAQLDSILTRAASVQAGWRRQSFNERARVVARVGALLRSRQKEHAALITREMGKPLRQAEAEIEKCAACCDYYAENAAGFLAPEHTKTEATRSYVVFQPLGVLLAIMPWNFPFWQVIRAAIPALMASNAVVLKHASNVTGCALAVEAIFREAGAPEGLFAAVLVSSKRASALVEHRAIAAVTLTGSTAAGASVAAAAGANLKKTVLELGGSDAYVVLGDADIEAAAAACVTSRLINSGQSCIAAKRFIVVESVRPRFEELFAEKMRAQKVGDPFDPETTIGPLARHDLRETLEDQVQRSLRAGAKPLLGGTRLTGPGAFFPPTVLTGVRPGMSAFDEETFGPVAAIVPAADEEQAIVLANTTVFGLGAAVFTKDAARGEAVARELEAGCCFVNDYVRSDPRLPFGGIKQSGYGRELGQAGIREFVNAKTICVR
jgi:succinate-semialdehyde dehydrogenase/glutarate-semialdehyde dehydrogenase